MVNSEVYLKKSESLRSSQYIGSFPGYAALTLPDSISQQVVEQATTRLTRYIDDYDTTVRRREENNNIGWVRHSQITLDQQIGFGSFSEVYTIQSIKSSKNKKVYKAPDVVLKMTRKDLTSKPKLLAKCAANPIKEGLILSGLSHENVIKVHAWTPTGLHGFHIGRSDSFFLILEKLRMTLSEKLLKWENHSKILIFTIRNRSAKKVEYLRVRLDVLLQLTSGLKYLHSKRVLHRDLKPDNIGFDCSGILKIYDFDTCRKLPRTAIDDPIVKFDLTQNSGSKRYMSPECALSASYNLKSDVYAWALISHEILTLARPFQDIPSEHHDEYVYRHGVRPEIPDAWPKGFKKLLETCWSEDIDERYDMHTAKKKLKKQIPLLLEAKNMKHPLLLKSKSTLTSSKGSSKSSSRRRAITTDDDKTDTTNPPSSPASSYDDDSERPSSSYEDDSERSSSFRDVSVGR